MQTTIMHQQAFGARAAAPQRRVVVQAQSEQKPAAKDGINKAVAAALSAAIVLQGAIVPAAIAATEFTLPPLPYAASALEPNIDEKTMTIHHDKHHQAYITSLNAALKEAPKLDGQSLPQIVKAVGTDAVPDKVKTAVRNHSGGTWNHSFFWKIMGPAASSGAPSGSLKAAIDKDLGGMDKLKETFATTAKGVFGSGWAWVVVTPDGKLAITGTPNQDNPLMDSVVAQKGIPIMGIDVWEHAYYLKHQNKRPDYIGDWWGVVNWQQVSANYEAAVKGEVLSFE